MSNIKTIDGLVLEPIYIDHKKIKSEKIHAYENLISSYRFSLVKEILCDKNYEDISIGNLNRFNGQVKRLGNAKIKEIIDVNIVLLNNILFGHKQLFDAVLANNDERVNEILFFRSKGWTLEEIGNEYDLTRERIRQLELRGRKSFHSFLDLLLIYTVESNGVINFDVIEGQYSDEEERLLINLIKTSPDVTYLKEFDKYIFGLKAQGEKHEKYCKQILELEFVSHHQILEFVSHHQIVECLEQMENENIDYIDKEDLEFLLLSKKYYKKDESFISLRKVSTPYLYMINKHFKKGINLQQSNSTDDYVKLVNLTIKEFPQIVEHSNVRSLISRLSEHLVPIDRSVYIIKEHFNYDKKIVNQILSEIRDAVETTFYFNEIVSIYKERLINASIRNRYELRSAFIIENGGNFEFTRDAIYKKNTEFINLEENISSFLMSRNSSVSVDEIREEFKHTSKERIFHVLLTDEEIINWGYMYYRHISTIEKPKKVSFTIQKIKEKLDSNYFLKFDEVKDLFIVNKDFSVMNTGYNSAINAILKLYYEDLFYYNDGYIWNKEFYIEDNYKRIKKYIGFSTHEEITMNKLKRYYTDNGWDNRTQYVYNKSIYENRILKDKNTYHKGNVHLSEDEIIMLRDIVIETIIEYGFTSSKLVLEDLDFIPKLFYWSEESVVYCVKKYLVDEVSFIPTGFNHMLTKFGVIVRTSEENDPWKCIEEYILGLGLTEISIHELNDLLTEIGVIKYTIPKNFINAESKKLSVKGYDEM